MKKIDAMGMVCPRPVIETKKVLRTEEGKDGVTVLVDNEIATQNLSKMAEGMNLESSVKKISDTQFEVDIVSKKDGKDNTEGMTIGTSQETVASSVRKGTYALAVGSEKMGEGAEELGKKLMGSFLYSLTEQDELPEIIVFYNSGVKLACEGSPVLEDLKSLSDKGVEIMSCGLCLDYYGIKENLKAGSVTNMYRILEIMRTYHTVKP